MYQTCCPECFHPMFLPDERFLGRKGVCPKCGHRFVLTPISLPLVGLRQEAQDAGEDPQDSQSTLDEVLEETPRGPTNRPTSVPEPDSEEPKPASDPDDEVVDLEELDREDDTLSEPTSISLEQHKQRDAGFPREEFPRRPPLEAEANPERWEDVENLSEEISLSDSVAAKLRPVADFPSSNGQQASGPMSTKPQAEAFPPPTRAAPRPERPIRGVGAGGGGDFGDGHLDVFRSPGLSPGPGHQDPPGSVGPRARTPHRISRRNRSGSDYRRRILRPYLCLMAKRASALPRASSTG